MATKQRKTKATEEQTTREPEQQVRRKPRPDPSAVNQTNAYNPAAAYARAPEMGGSDQSLAGVEGGAGGPGLGGTTAAAPDVVPGGTATLTAGTATGTRV